MDLVSYESGSVSADFNQNAIKFILVGMDHRTERLLLGSEIALKLSVARV